MTNLENFCVYHIENFLNFSKLTQYLIIVDFRGKLFIIEKNARFCDVACRTVTWAEKMNWNVETTNERYKDGDENIRYNTYMYFSH